MTPSIEMKSAPGTCCPDMDLEAGWCRSCGNRNRDNRYAVCVEGLDGGELDQLVRACDDHPYVEFFTYERVGSHPATGVRYDVTVCGFIERVSETLLSQAQAAKSQGYDDVYHTNRRVRVDLRRAQKRVRPHDGPSIVPDSSTAMLGELPDGG